MIPCLTPSNICNVVVVVVDVVIVAIAVIINVVIIGAQGTQEG